MLYIPHYNEKKNDSAYLLIRFPYLGKSTKCWLLLDDDEATDPSHFACAHFLLLPVFKLVFQELRE